MNQVFLFADLREPNGKTIRQNNMEEKHSIPEGTLVEIDCQDVPEWHGCRLYIIKHGRDCDGTPLYSLGAKGETNRYKMICNGWSETSLKVILFQTESPVTPELSEGLVRTTNE